MMARPSLLTIMRLLLFFSFLAIVSTFVDAIPTGEQKYYLSLAPIALLTRC